MVCVNRSRSIDITSIDPMHPMHALSALCRCVVVCGLEIVAIPAFGTEMENDFFLAEAEAVCGDPLNPNACWVGGYNRVHYFDGEEVSEFEGTQRFRYSQRGKAQFSHVTALLCTRDRRYLYVADELWHSLIRRIDLATSVVTVVGGSEDFPEDVTDYAVMVFDQTTKIPESAVWLLCRRPQTLRHLNLTTGEWTAHPLPPECIIRSFALGSV